ncbi:MAG: aldo/keto reductase [Corynebacterium sp.]|uniref:aldo/keto reductase n=1 Tax=unclassified Corynebacterium TaxID=2624378 RepID=UPI002649C13E|nr:aldo/keto reductase [Corynebacterium sp.]MDN5582543.1 aldo/keto reductase [Corynebacterium sp.]MDN5720089.1 aldo/keto reductase [Corynebacterium sp.]MDN6324410.1 aldo/keto reductase [Corynebacterium sp.]
MTNAETAQTAQTVTLNDGHEIPQLGLGVWELSPEDAYASTRAAISAGARHIDTAAAYGNESDVGRAIADAIAEGEVTRDDLYVTTKLWNADQAPGKAAGAIDTSLANLGLDHVDLWLIHWPVPSYGRYVDAWRALIEAREAGKTTSIGVSNFYPEVLDEIIDATGVVPAVNQIELHPGLSQQAQRADDAKRGIVTEAWSPLGRGLLDHPVVTAVADEVGASAAQVIVRWHLQQGIVVFPRSSKAERVKENLDVDGFELSDEQIDRITALDDDEAAAGRVGADPREASFGVPEE